MRYLKNRARCFGLLACVVLAGIIVSCTSNPKQEEVVIDANLPIEEQIALVTAEIEQDRMNAGNFHQRAQLHLLNRNPDLAADDIAVALKLDSGKPDFYYTLSDILFAKGDMVLATEALSDGLELDPENVRALLALAEMYYALRDMKQSVTLLKRVTAIEPHNAQAFLIHGLIFTELGDTARAIGSFQTAVENNPDLEEAYLELGMLYYAKLNPLTVDYLNNVITLNPKNILAMYTKAMYFQKTGEADLAIDSYLEILVVAPSHPEAHYNLGHVKIEFKSDYASAVDHFSKAIEADPSHFKAYYMRGLCNENLNKIEEARADYKKSLDLETNYELAIQGLNRLDEKS